jgi:predicted AAA+ superfamily ATPase
MFKIYREKLLDDGVLPVQIQELNFEDADISDLLDWKKLHDRIKSGLVPDRMNYIFLDEIQNVREFERAVGSLRLRDNVDLYITGSNSRILSGELATLLSGRYVNIHMLPLSFKEYASAYPFAGTAKDEMFGDYLRNSSFPYAARLTGDSNRLLAPGTRWDKELIRQFLKGLFDTIVLKDVVERKNVKSVSRLNCVIKFMFANIGRETSIRNIKNTLESESGIKIDVSTIESYLDGLMDAFVLYKTGRYDIRGKQHLKTNAKYYAADIGLRYLLSGREDGAGQILENVIYLELLRRGYDISIGKIDAAEVDFAAVRGGAVEYYQVSQDIGDKTTRERELKSLDMIDNHNPKFLLTMDRPFAEEHKGIKIINALDWLLGEGREVTLH